MHLPRACSARLWHQRLSALASGPQKGSRAEGSAGKGGGEVSSCDVFPGLPGVGVLPKVVNVSMVEWLRSCTNRNQERPLHPASKEANVINIGCCSGKSQTLPGRAELSPRRSQGLREMEDALRVLPPGWQPGRNRGAGLDRGAGKLTCYRQAATAATRRSMGSSRAPSPMTPTRSTLPARAPRPPATSIL